MYLDLLEPVKLGESVQWVRVRSAAPGNPLLLLIQQGPGLPMINEIGEFGRLLRLEAHFTVVYWDQRGCGLSLRAADGTRATLQAMARDAQQLLEVLSERFGPATVVGFSLGGAVAALAAANRPDLVEILVAVAPDVDGPAAESFAYDFALDMGRQRRDRKAIRQLEAIGRPPHLTPQAFTTRVRWASNFGGVRAGRSYNSMARSLVWSLLRSADYSLPDVVRTLRAVSTTQAALLAELATLDLARRVPRLERPVFMIQGRHDKVAPASALEQYAEVLEAPRKTLVWFEHSRHMPHFEEPEKFRRVLLQARSLVGADRCPSE
jgi:pimeloyl-ACP methyl ester carboxylesterase